MNANRFSRLRTALSLLALSATAVLRLSAQGTPTFTNVSVHDPSVIKEGTRWYVYGSHAASAWTTDLMNWTQVSTSVTSGSPTHFNTFSSELSELIAWTSATTLWAADVRKLPDGKFYYYYNVWNNPSSLYRSYMGLATSTNIEGPYLDQGELLRGGDTGFNAALQPNTVDPAVFFDAAGKLWMVYGSYSGGIFILELENTIGSATYGKPKPGQANSGFGKKLFGNNHAQIEGSYIVYDPDTAFYYMFLSFGGLGAEAGTYNMRVVRSVNPDGPYLDSGGNDVTALAVPNSALATIAPYGVKLMGNVQFAHVTGDQAATATNGYVCPGHCSVYRDPTTKQYSLIFHTRFYSTTANQGHEVRVHQMYMNTDGWPVAAPHRYAGETMTTTNSAQLLGDFKVIVQSKSMPVTTGSGSAYVIPMNTSSVATFHADGTITGAYTGTWQLTGDHFATIVIGGTTYKGVYSTQWDNDNRVWVPTFSAISSGAAAAIDNGVSLWGSKVTATTIAPAIASQPASMTLAAGSSLTFNPGITGTFTPDVQWYKNGVAIAGATGSTYTIANASASHAGNYTFTAINAAGSVTSSTASITVGSSVPATQTVISGHEVSLISGATGTGIQWQISTNGGSSWTNLTNNSTYTGVTTGTLVIANASSTLDGALYRTLTTGGGTSSTSSPLTLTVAPALLSSPVSVALDSSGNLFVSDNTNHTIDKITSAGAFSILAGTTGTQGSIDGTGAAASFRTPTGLALDTDGNVYVTDTGNSTVRKITSAGVVTTLAGSASNSGTTDGTGSAARFASPADVTVKSDGTLYIADTANHTVRQVSSAGAVTTLAGSAGNSGTADGIATAARFNAPAGIAINAAGASLYIADTTNNTLRTATTIAGVNPAGVVTTLAGTYGVAGSANGTGSAATFSGPTGAAVDSTGNIYVADTQNSTIRKITSTGVVTTVAGLPGVAGLKDGTGSEAWFNKPRDVAIDASGNLFVADTGNAAIRKITAAGVVSTLTITASSSSSSSSSSGGGSSSGPVQPPAPTPSSGGGGGAPSLAFLGAVLALGALRKLARR